MEQLTIIKIGGNVLDNEEALRLFLRSFAKVEGPRLLIHGGGKLATRLAEKTGHTQQLVDGRRVTDAETLDIVTMVYAGLINKRIISLLQGYGCNAFGLCGADGNAVQAHKRESGVTDYGFVGDIDRVNSALLHQLLQNQLTPVLAPITHDGKGQLLNTNADTIAQATALALSSLYRVRLVYSFEKAGVLTDLAREDSVVPRLTPAVYQSLKEAGSVFAGMLPKLDNAFAALKGGVDSVVIGKANPLAPLLEGKTGTRIAHD
jgi:acetylglutamate kinase